jgi:hypothetical protein
MPTLLNFGGYKSPDPLDKAPAFASYAIPILINLILSVLVIYSITHFRIVYFNGFTIRGHYFSYHYSELLEILINCLVFAPLISFTRKSSSLIPFLIVFVPYYSLDLFIQSRYRMGNHSGLLAFWDYNDDSFISGITYPAVKFLLTMSFDAFIFGILSLYLSRLLAAIIYAHKPYPPNPTREQYQALFSEKWSDEPVAKPKRDAAFWILRLLGFAYLFYLVILILGLLGSGSWPGKVGDLIKMTYDNPALAINTYFKISLMIILAFIGAYNKSLRFYSCLAMLTGHAVSTIYSLVFHFVPALDKADPTGFLLTSAITDGSLIIIFLWIVFKYKKDAQPFAPEHDFPINFSVPMTIMVYLFKGMSLIFLLLVAGICYVRIGHSGYVGISAVFGSPDPMIGNTVTLYSTLALISYLLIKRERLRQHFFNALTVPLIFGSLVAILWLIFGGRATGVRIQTRHDTYAIVNWYFVVYAVFNLGIAFLLIFFRRMYYSVDYSINSISPSAAINAIALTQALFVADDKYCAAVLQSIDQYAGGIRGRKRGLLNLPFALLENILNFIYGMRPAFSTMSRDEQRYFLRKYFLRNENERAAAAIPQLAEFAYQIGTTLNSMVMFANYSYINARNDIGYVPVDARDRTQGDCASYRPPHKSIAPLPSGPQDQANFKPPTECKGPLVAPRVTTPVKEEEIPEEVDYLIVGSGAGGATAAYRLSCTIKDPAKILVVESGDRFQPLQDFQDSEIEMMKKIYKEGGLQQTKTFLMTVLQGECVGGSTVTNNAVCFSIPDNIKTIWQQDYDIDLSGIQEEYDLIAKELSIQPLGDLGINELVQEKFLTAVKKYNAQIPVDQQLSVDNPVLVNHLNNMGDGNWNLGNKRMRKRSMLETYIPWSESRGVKYVSNMTAVRFIPSATGTKADAVLLRADNGALKKVIVKKGVIVAGGVIASSQFLMRSEVANANIGQRMSCNFAFPVSFDFDQELRAYDGDQITLAALDPKSRSAFETYFNPPAAFALSSVPFFFDRRDALMNRYKYLVNFGSLIGSEPNGNVLKKADLVNGQAFAWTLGVKDISNIKYGMTTLIQLGKLAGATRAILPTKPGIELSLTDDAGIREFNRIFNDFPLRMKDMFIGTAHPQGGNMIAGKNSTFKSQRVLNEDFLVDGLDNVFVADASIFPTSITINPQWTIMALSSLVAKSVLKNCP